ncbi:unnamed protein product [Amoebophrya sp. A120]|nr:unnamed protein product [Amoebophrya sp. A120]|eukprot:GSA120T00024329001.1
MFGLVAPFAILLQAATTLWIWSVWTWRYALKTAFKPAGCSNRVAEFKTYGFPSWMLGVIGFFELFFATLLTIGIMLPKCMFLVTGSLGLMILMTGAVAAHAKVRDPFVKYCAALGIGIAAVIVFAYSVVYFLRSSTNDYETINDLIPKSFDDFFVLLESVFLYGTCAPDGTELGAGDCVSEMFSKQGLESFNAFLLPVTCLLPSQPGRICFTLLILIISGVMLTKSYKAGVYRRKLSQTGIFDANVMLLDKKRDGAETASSSDEEEVKVKVKK